MVVKVKKLRVRPVKRVKRVVKPREWPEVREARGVRIPEDFDYVRVSGPAGLWRVRASRGRFAIGCYERRWEDWVAGFWGELQALHSVPDGIRRRYEAVFEILRAKVERLNRRLEKKKAG